MASSSPASTTSAPSTASATEEGFAPLFDGRTLRGWEPVGSPENAAAWSVQDGTIVCSGQGRGWLRTARIYRNFVLRIEYATGAEGQGNSGIFLRSQLEGRPAYNGMEIQILNDRGAPPTTKSTGAIYDAVAPTKNMAGGVWEWSAVEATCRGTHVTVVHNGEKIVDVDLETLAAGRGQPREGYIGIQNHHAPVKFRNVRVKQL